MSDKKICPKCKTPMKTAEFVCGLPTMKDEKKNRGTEAMSTEIGIPVSVYQCPKCQFIELYHYTR